MRIVIVGATALGEAAVRKLIEGGHDVVVVDGDRDRLEALAESHDCGVIHGDGTLPSVLREAGGEALDALLALSDSDEANILCAMVGRSVGYRRVVPKIVQPELRPICDELELADMITPHETVAADLLDRLEGREAGTGAGDPHLSGDLRLVSFLVSGALAGRKASALDFDRKARLVAVERGEETMLARDDTALEEADTLLLVVRREDAEAVNERLKHDDRESADDAKDGGKGAD
jgi:trk system potassium uptake protein TrkA